jgi:YD repeat-containing protein
MLNCYQGSDDADCTSLVTETGNNGNVQGQKITRGSQNWTQTYAYDGVNRLSGSLETSNWSQSYGYDAFGNRWAAGWNPSSLTPTTNVFNAATNRVNGASYDGRWN